jgi:anionic cell wall polymer biosynthesis LytR-Cps2A-Psr (LCP) family protein
VEQFLSMLNGNLDLNITEYVIVDFSAVATLVDDLDGIDILLTEEEIIHLNNYCVETAEVTGMDYEPLQYERGQEVTEYHLNGVQAVAYARIRYTVGDDLKRTQRQRLVIEKIVDKAKVKGITSISKIINDVFPLIKTSFSSAQLTKMAAQMFNYNIEKTSGFPFETLPCQIGSLDAIVPVTLKDNVVELHYYLFDEENYEVSYEVASYSQEIEETSGFGAEYRESAIEYGTVKDNGGEADITR